MKQKEIFVSIFFLLFTAGSAGRAFGFEPAQYDIKAEIDVGQRIIRSSQSVTFTNNAAEAVDHLYFHIYPNRHYTEKEKNFMLLYAGYFKVNPFPEGFQTGRFHIRSILQEGRTASFHIEGEDQTLLKVSLNKALPPGESTQVQMDFTVTIPHAYGRFGWHENIITLSRWYPILSVYNQDGLPALPAGQAGQAGGRQGWHTYPFYPFHRPFFSEASYYSVELTVPHNQVVIHSADLEREAFSPEGTKTLYFKSKLPIREFSLAMSPDYQVYEQNWQGINLKSFYLPGHQKAAQEALESARGLMDFYTRLFGPYPYQTFSIAPVYLGYGGEQMSNMAFIDTRVYELPGILKRYFDFLIAHETGHQWFYNLVGIDEYTQMWLEEGVHSYFLLRYLEEKYGPQAKVVEFPEWFKVWEWLLPNPTLRRTRDVRYKMIARIGFDHPVAGELSSFQEPSSIFSVTYGKGSRIVEMLAHTVGQETLDKVFRKIFEEYRFRNLYVKDFIRLCAQESGQNLEWFFNQWLYTDDYLDAAVTKVQGNKISLEHQGEIIMPVEVRVEFADGTKQDLLWDALPALPDRQAGGRQGGKSKEGIVLAESEPIKRVEIDPDKKMLDLDQTNNVWPRAVCVKPVPIYLGLYDMPVFMPDETYNLVYGPEIAESGLGVKASLQKPYEQNFYAAADYEFGESILHSRVGYQLSNLFHSSSALGFEIVNRSDYDDGDEDLVSGKVFLRHDLRPVQYGLADINEHVSLYVIRNQGLNTTLLLNGREDARNVSYLKRSEAIVGLALHRESAGPYPDPFQGFKVDTLFESSGHFLGATQFFNRASVDTAFYRALTPKTKLALRLKYGWGYPDDKNLFELGGLWGLRGYDRKEIRGARAFLGSLEYRFPLTKDLRWGFFDHILGLESVGGVVFVDAGQSWFDDFDESSLKKDAGLGLRFTVNIGSFLEKVIVRADVAQAINESDEDPRFWFGLNHAF